ncbi:MAG: transporter substrate-binding domain-containing protein, partial [Cetobacterium sp.]
LEEVEKKIEEYPAIIGCRVIPNSSKNSLLAYYIRKVDQNELLNKINTALDELKKDGTYETLLKKYM